MTPRERMQAVLKGETPDAMAWFGDMTYWFSAHRIIGDLPERWEGSDGLLKLHRELNVGGYVPGCSGGDTLEGDDVHLDVTEVGGRRVTRWDTSLGAVHEVQIYLPTSFSWGYTEHAVKTVADLRVVRHIYEHRGFIPRPERYPMEDRRYAAYGSGPTHIAAPPTPLSELNKHWIGVMDLACFLIDQPDEMARTLAAIQHAHDDVYRQLAGGPQACIMICENLSGATMGSYFDEYLAPPLTRWCQWLHEGGHIVMLHNDGTLRGTLEKLAAVGVDVVDSVVPRPVGDVEIADLRALAGDDILLLGGLPGAMFAPPFTARDMERQVREIIRVHKDSGTFMFGVSDQVPPNGDLELVKLVGALIDAYGRY